MTNAVERMMKEYCKPKYFYNVVLRDTLVPEDEFPLDGCTKGEVINYCTSKFYLPNSCKVTKVVKHYPKFTAEKQIELIKLIGKTLIYDTLGQELKYWIDVGEFSLEHALAIITVDYKDELDTAKVKEILEK